MLLVCQASKFRSDIVMEVDQYKPTLSRSELLANLPRLEKLQAVFDLSLPSELEGVIQKVEPKLILILDLDVSSGFTLSPRISYEGSKTRVVPGSHGQYLSSDENMVIERNHAEEKALYTEFINRYPFEEEPDKNHEIHIPEHRRADIPGANGRKVVGVGYCMIRLCHDFGKVFQGLERAS